MKDTGNTSYFELKLEDFKEFESRHNKYMVHNDIDVLDRDKVISSFENEYYNTKQFIEETFSSKAAKYCLIGILLNIVVLIISFMLNWSVVGGVFIFFSIGLSLFSPIIHMELLNLFLRNKEKLVSADKLKVFNTAIEYYDNDDGFILLNTNNTVNRYGDYIDITDEDNYEDTFIVINKYKIKLSLDLEQEIAKIKSDDELIDYGSNVTMDLSGDRLGDVMIIVPSKYYKVVLDNALDKEMMKSRVWS